MMQREQWDRMKELFARADELSPDARPEYLAGACGDDVGLREMLEALLAATPADHEGDPGVARPARDEDAEPHLLPPGTRVGGFTIVGPVGAGGMGAVYRAEQDKPRRTVALKLIRPGLVSRATLQRFEFEAEVLARLEHPGIARVYEAGTADVGAGPQPFFAMELVEGQTLDHHLAAVAPPLRPRQRVELLLRICQAVEHAHGRGIVHRDLKPENILITADGHPKVLDFGVARAVDADVRAATLHTQTGQVLGTVPYMAPEQVRGRVNELDAATDVYALGVIGYELLSGRMPYPVKDAALPEAARVICEREPSRLSSIDRGLRGDVETIIGKALEKDKARRYPAAGALAADLRRYLDYEPITARAPGTWYQLARFARRNRALVGGAAAVFVVLVAGIVATTRFALLAHRARAVAEARQRETEQVAQFQARLLGEIDVQRMGAGLRDDLLADARGGMERAGAVPEGAARDVESLRRLLAYADFTGAAARAIDRTILRAAAPVIDRDFAAQPLVRASLLHTLSSAYVALGMNEQAVAPLAQALEIRTQRLGPDHPDTLASQFASAYVLRLRGKARESEPVFRDVLARQRRVLGDDHPDTRRTIMRMVVLLRYLNRVDEAEPFAREAEAAYARVPRNDTRESIDALMNLAGLARARGREDEAAPLLRELLERQRRVGGPDDAGALSTLNDLGSVLQHRGQLDEAEDCRREVLERRRRALGDDHPSTLTALNNLAMLLFERRRFADAEPLFHEAIERFRRVRGNDHPNTHTALLNYGAMLSAAGRPAEAEAYCRAALDGRRRAHGPDHPLTVSGAGVLAHCLREQRKYAEAEQLYRDCLATRRRTLGDEHQQTISTMFSHAEVLRLLNRPAEALPLYSEAAERARVHPDLGPDHPDTRRYMAALARQ